MTDSPYLTSQEVADLLRTSPVTIRYWRHKGKGPRALKVGRRVLYDRRDVQSFLDRQRETYTPRRDGTPVALD